MNTRSTDMCVWGGVVLDESWSVLNAIESLTKANKFPSLCPCVQGLGCCLASSGMMGCNGARTAQLSLVGSGGNGGGGS